MDKKLEVRGRVFRTNADYARAWHDNRTIEQIESNLDKNNPEQVKELRLKLEQHKYHFESIVGDDFVEEIMELDEKLSRRPPEVVPEKKGSRFNRKNVEHNRNIIGDEESPDVIIIKKPKTNNINKNEVKAESKTDKSSSRKSSKVVQSDKGTYDKKASFDDYDSDMQTEIVRALKKQQRRRRLYMSFLALCIIGSLGYLIFYYSLYEKNEVEYNDLSVLVKEDVGGTVEINYEEAKDKPPVLKKYETLYKKNRKMVGWLKIENCGIDYPVMQTSDNEYYLDHNYSQEYDKNGSIFMDYNCTPAFPNDNMILYGHHMKSGKMFGNLNLYSKQSFWEKNQTFTFDTIYETGTYAVMYVFRDKIHTEDEIVFKYYQFIDATSQDEFYSNMDAMNEMSLYDTGVTASYGDKLITLSTCDSSEKDGRFVVVAKKIM